MTKWPRLTFAALVLFAFAFFGDGWRSCAEASATHVKSGRRSPLPGRAGASKAKVRSSASALLLKSKSKSRLKTGSKGYPLKRRESPRAAAKHSARLAASAVAKRRRGRDARITAPRLRHGSRGKPPGPHKARVPTGTPWIGPAPAFAVGPAQVPAASLAGKIEGSEHLARFFARLQEVETGDNQQTVRILQFGDAHTATDIFTGRLRLLFQQRFGNGGAGFTYAGQPFAGYGILDTSRGQSAGWVEEGIPGTKMVKTALGLGGVASTSTRLGDFVSLDAPCSLLQVQYLVQPGGGAFSVWEDGRVLSHITTDDPVAPETYESPCSASSGDGGVHHFKLVADSSRPVRIFGTVTERPGVTYEALGLKRAEAALMLRWDQSIFTSYLKQRDPALIALAFGTNEASNRNWTYESYTELLGRLVNMLHATAPEAAILIIGPPDLRLHAGGSRRPAHRTGFEMIDAQRDVCRRHGCAFWDWRARMGGPGSMNRWVSDGLAQPDHTHFKEAGYVHLADLFYSDMVAAYDVWKGRYSASPTVVRSISPQP